jgi:L-histidine N-alpha-methyltransferase
VLEVINRELKADFDPLAFEHVAKWNADAEWIEMWLRSARAQTVTIGALDLAVEFAAGEEMRTEVSAKFRPDGVRDELAAAGLRLQHWWTDPTGDFGLSLSIPV